jgi:hypothetical protein
MTPKEILEIHNLVDRADAAIKYCMDHSFASQKPLFTAISVGFDILKRQRDLRYDTEYLADRQRGEPPETEEERLDRRSDKHIKRAIQSGGRVPQ